LRAAFSTIPCLPGLRQGPECLRSAALQGSADEFVGFERDLPTRKQTDRFLRRHGVEVRYKMELDNTETMKRVVEIGTGCAFLPQPAIRQEAKNRTLIAIEIPDDPLLRLPGIVYSRGERISPAREKLMEYLCAR